MAEPKIQWFGRGLGQKGSTSKLGAIAAAASASGASTLSPNTVSPKAPARTAMPHPFLLPHVDPAIALSPQ